jgi:hypothetical protein
MGEAPERIWWNGVCGEGGYASTVRFAGGTEYVRADYTEEADLSAAREAAARREGWNAAIEAAAKEIGTGTWYCDGSELAEIILAMKEFDE